MREREQVLYLHGGVVTAALSGASVNTVITGWVLVQVHTWRPSFLWAMSRFLRLFVFQRRRAGGRLRAGKSFQQLNEQDFSLVFKGRKVFLVGTYTLPL